MRPEKLCPSCQSDDLLDFYQVEQIPIHSVMLLDSAQQALECARGDIALSFCQQCGFISNRSFDPNLHKYGAKYESTQSFSPTFGAFARRQVAEIVDRYNLRAKTIIEIGCGNGEFLNLICDLGRNRGIGFDPAYVSGRVQSQVDVEFVKDFYSEKYMHFRADFLICKMTLEHVPNVNEFVGMIRRSLEDNPETIVHFQVPNMEYILRDTAFWDIYYEHCSYFSPGALARLFQRHGFHILDLRLEYDQQYVVLEAQLADLGDFTPAEITNDLDELRQCVVQFQDVIPTRLMAWKAFFVAQHNSDKRVVLWGSGSKGVALLSTLGIYREVKYCVDINPHKHGTFMAGTGQEIISPAFLQEYIPDVVIIMNPVYKAEIGRQLEQLDLDVEIVTVDSFDV